MRSIRQTCGHSGSVTCAAASSRFAVTSHQLDAVLNPQLPTQALATGDAEAQLAAGRPIKISRRKHSTARQINDALATGAAGAH